MFSTIENMLLFGVIKIVVLFLFLFLSADLFSSPNLGIGAQRASKHESLPSGHFEPLAGEAASTAHADHELNTPSLPQRVRTTLLPPRHKSPWSIQENVRKSGLKVKSKVLG